MESTTNENCIGQLRPLHSENQSLASIHRSWGFPTDDEILWLLDQGIDEKALWPISGATVHFDAPTFELNDSGERALIFRAEDRGELIDLIAWQPRTGALASWRGQAFCLGDVDDIFNPVTYFAGDALHVHAKPLDWLLANREGHRNCAARLGSRLSCELPAHSLLECSPRPPGRAVSQAA
jgi:hypothetical protein